MGSNTKTKKEGQTKTRKIKKRSHQNSLALSSNTGNNNNINHTGHETTSNQTALESVRTSTINSNRKRTSQQ